MSPGEVSEEEARQKQKRKEEEERLKKERDAEWQAKASKTPLSTDTSFGSTGRKGWSWIFFGLSGRLEQRRFVIGTLSLGAVFISVVHYTFWAGFPLFGIEPGGNYFYLYDNPTGYPVPWWYGFFWAWIIFGYPTYALVSKRLMDLDQEPLLALGFMFVVIIIFIGPLVQVGMWIWLVATPGTEGSNKFGHETQVAQTARIYR